MRLKIGLVHTATKNGEDIHLLNKLREALDKMLLFS